MDVADMPAAVSGAARVLKRGGCFCTCVVHPLLDAGRWDDQQQGLREPEPPAAPQRRLPFRRRIPLFLMWRAVKP